MQRNSETVKRLCETLYKKGFEKVKEGIIAPKEANTARVPQFAN
ncbi:MAG: hypothetical protein KGJ59_06570 [Bacteroidota bacterium]|nr:hypothetical protein [Bacteroidota bacterium]